MPAKALYFEEPESTLTSETVHVEQGGFGILGDDDGMDLDAVMRVVTADAKNLMLIARVGRVVMTVSDPVLEAILADAAASLVRMAFAIRTKLADDTLPIAFEGPVFHNPAVRDRFIAATNAVPAQLPPAEGAVLRASRARNRDMGWQLNS